MLLLIGPAVAVIGIVAVFFVMRHKSVEKHSMYASRRSQIEHKVRAARQRTLGPVKKAEKPSQVAEDTSAAASGVQTWQQPAYASPPAAPPEAAPARPAWDTGPTAPAPSPPAYTPQAPAYEPAQPEAPPAAQTAWTPTSVPETARPAPPEPAPAQAAATSAGGGAAWSVVGETKAEPEPAPSAKKKKGKDEAQGSAWTLASGDVAGDDADEGPRKPSAVLAIAQYAVLVVGLVMVLIGVVVMVANSHPA